MITVKVNNVETLRIESRIVLNETVAHEFEDHPSIVENMAQKMGQNTPLTLFEHHIEHVPNGVMSVAVKIKGWATPEEMEELGRVHSHWIKDVIGTIEAQTMAEEEELKRIMQNENECQSHEPIDFSQPKELEEEEEMEFLKQLLKDMVDCPLPTAAKLEVPIFGVVGRIGYPTLRKLIEKYVS